MAGTLGHGCVILANHAIEAVIHKPHELKLIGTGEGLNPDAGIAAGTPFEAIPDDWQCPICGVRKASFVPYREAELKSA